MFLCDIFPGMGSSDEWSEFQEIIDSTPELEMCVDPRVYGGNRYNYTLITFNRQHSYSYVHVSPIKKQYFE